METIPLSALQHWHYCPRQCGLIHLEQVFDENVHTLRGQAVHARVDKPGVESAEGALYYATSKRRRVVPITPELRSAVAQTAQAPLTRQTIGEVLNPDTVEGLD